LREGEEVSNGISTWAIDWFTAIIYLDVGDIDSFNGYELSLLNRRLSWRGYC
jgi:hypothetical protein